MSSKEQLEFIKSNLMNFEVIAKNVDLFEDVVLRNKILTCISMGLSARVDEIAILGDFMIQLEMLVNGELMNSSTYSDKNRIFEILEVFLLVFAHLKKCDWFICDESLHKKLFLAVKLGMRNYVEFVPYPDDEKSAHVFSAHLDKLIESEFFGSNITIKFFNKEEKFEIFKRFIQNFEQLEQRPGFGDNGRLHNKLFYLVKMRRFGKLNIHAENIEEHVDSLFPKIFLQNLKF